MLKDEIDALVEQIEQLVIDLTGSGADMSPLEQWLDSLTIPEGYMKSPCTRTWRKYPY